MAGDRLRRGMIGPGTTTKQAPVVGPCAGEVPLGLGMQSRAGLQAAACSTCSPRMRCRSQVEISTQHITKLFRKCEAQLKQFGSLPSSTDADEKVRGQGLGRGRNAPQLGAASAC